MADVNDIINDSKMNKQVALTDESNKPIPTETEVRKNNVDKQLADLFKIEKRTKVPTPEELKKLTDDYFENIYPENYGKYTFHIFIGMTDQNITAHILTSDALKEIYDFAIEKMKAKAEITMQIAGRSTDGFAMQNLAGWRKKDPEDEEKTSGLAELHSSMRERRKQLQQKKENNQ